MLFDKCRSWSRIGRMSCSAGHEHVLEVKVKMRRFREKEMMGPGRVGSKVEPIYEPISFFSQGLPSPLSIISNPPIRYFTAACTFWGANCLLNDYFTAFEAV